MSSRRLSALLLLVTGMAFLLISFTGETRNNAYIPIGIVFVILGAVALRRRRTT